MALTPLSGSSSTTSTPTSHPPQTNTDKVAQAPFIRDPNLNRYAIDTTQYLSATKALIGFGKGKRVPVTYYRLLKAGGSNIRSNIADQPTMRNVLNTEYQKIKNLEITLPKGFDFQSNQDQASGSITGSAMMYPGMNPNIGDLFTCGVGDGRVGLCIISSVDIHSWLQDRIYTVTFVVKQFVDPSVQDPIDGAVTLVSVFSKTNYLGGTSALLSEQTYTQLNHIRQLRSSLCKMFHASFFDDGLNSYVRPDGVYDPWVVLFMTNKVRMDDVFIRPKALLGRAPDLYRKTLWSRLEDAGQTSLYGLSPCFQLTTQDESDWGVYLSELVNRSVVMPSADLDHDPYYLFTKDFWTGQTTKMSAEELLVYTAITQRTIGSLSVLVSNYLDLITTWDRPTQFYHVPIMLHLIDMALQSQYREIDTPYLPGSDSDA